MRGTEVIDNTNERIDPGAGRFAETSSAPEISVL